MLWFTYFVWNVCTWIIKLLQENTGNNYLMRTFFRCIAMTTMYICCIWRPTTEAPKAKTLNSKILDRTELLSLSVNTMQIGHSYFLSFGKLLMEDGCFSQMKIYDFCSTSFVYILDSNSPPELKVEDARIFCMLNIPCIINLHPLK